MAKKIYTGVSEKARNVKNIYIGVNGVARKVKKAYIGVNDKARLFYDKSSSSNLSWKRTTTISSPLETRYIAYGNSKFVAFPGSSSNNYCFYGLSNSWSKAIISYTTYWGGVAAGNGLFVAIPSSGSEQKFIYSSNGYSWTVASFPYTVGSWRAIAYVNGKFIAVSDYSTIAYSSNGTSWSTATLPYSSGNLGVTYGNGKYVIVGSSGKGAYSSNGTSWTQMTLPQNQTYKGVAYGNGKFVAIGAQTAAVSSNGTSWSQVTLPASTYTSYESIAFGNEKFIVVGNDSIYSDDGNSWNRILNFSGGSSYGVAYGNNQFAATDISGNFYYLIL